MADDKDPAASTGAASATNMTELLKAWDHGQASALSELMPLVYDELRRVARAHLRREQPGHTLQTTALVHEAYLRLARLDRIAVVGRAHFLALSARLMRQILVDEARKKQASRRGAGVMLVPLEAVSPAERDRVVDVIMIDEALAQLARVDAQQARIVELKFFAGLTADETAVALGISVATVHRDWAMAKAWLHSRLRA